MPPLTPSPYHLQRLWFTTKTLLMLSALGLAAFWCLTSTLDDMTKRDCQLGISAACKQVGMPIPKPPSSTAR